MSGTDGAGVSYDLLDDWKNQLQVTYLQQAAKIAKWEKTNGITSERDQYRQLDRLARDIERAEYALKLFRLQHLSLSVESVLKARDQAA